MGASSRKRRGNIVLLRTDSFESLMKAKAYADAARALGFAVRDYPDAETLGIWPASDFRALEAAWLCRSYGVPGPDPVAVAIARSKSLTYEFLRRKGFDMLRWLVPLRERDLGLPFKGPIIVKPDSGSGSSSNQPWGYRVFDGLRDFKRYLHKQKLLERFFANQVGAAQDRQVVMEYVDAELWSIATIAGDGDAMLYDSNVMSTLPGSKVMGRILIGARHPDTANAVRMAKALSRAGLRRSVIYLQCVPRRGRLCVFDLNLRPGTMWECAAVSMNVRAHEELVSVLLGLKEKTDIRWPGRYVGVVRVPGRLQPGRMQVRFAHADAIPVVDEARYDPSKPYDAGHAWPMFAVLCRRADEFDGRARAIIASMKVQAS